MDGGKAPQWDQMRFQFEQLNAMERQQDVNLWTANSIYVAASAVVLVALFAQTDPSLARLRGLLPAVGFSIAISWLIISTRAHQRENRWLVRAKKLERVYSPVPRDYRVWDTPDDPDPLVGVRAVYAEYFLIFFFIGLWVVLSYIVPDILCVKLALPLALVLVLLFVIIKIHKPLCEILGMQHLCQPLSPD